jgi:DNA processing protein
MRSPDHLLAYLRLTRLKGVGPILLKRLLEALGTPDAILNAHPATLAAVEGIGTIKANQIVTSAPATEKPAGEELDRIFKQKITLLTFDDPAYPPALKTVPDPPLVLYVRGRIDPHDAGASGIVGARECTLYGREQSTRLAAQLAEAGLTVVSGGARGIDTCAHLGALRSKGRTIVVQGCGQNHTYPPENADLYNRIVNEDAGAIISELPLDAPPSKENFPPRNRIIAGMSLGILVIEANLRSGSLITARLAAADYGREVFALPGRVDSPASAGTHHLIKSAAAHLVESAEDILAHLGDVGQTLQKRAAETHTAQLNAQTITPPGPRAGISLQETLFTAPKPPATPVHNALTTLQQTILNALPADPTLSLTIDDLLDATSLAPSLLMAELTHLQLRSLITRLPANRFSRKR